MCYHVWAGAGARPCGGLHVVSPSKPMPAHTMGNHGGAGGVATRATPTTTTTTTTTTHPPTHTHTQHAHD